MKRICSLLMCILMCLSVFFTCAPVSFAASVKKVTKLSVSKVEATKITLKWKKVSGATGYRIYRYDASKDKYVSVGKTKKLSFTDKSLTAAKTYKYKVRAYKTKKKKNTYSAYSKAVSATTTPKKVRGLEALSVGTVTARLTWNKTKGAQGYTVYVYDNSKKKYVAHTTVTGTHYTMKRLSSNTRYKVKVAAYYEKGGKKVYGLKSSVCSFRTNLAAVSSVAVKDVTAFSYTLAWDSVKGAEAYQIARYNSSKKTWSVFATVDTNSYTISGLARGSSAQYKVRAVRTVDGELVGGAYSSSVTASTIAGVPQNLTASSNGETVTLSWKANGTAAGYEISRYNAANGSWETIGETAATLYTDDTVAETSTYTYRVRGYVNAGKNKIYTEYTSSVSVFHQSTSPSNNQLSQSMADSGILGYLYDPNENCFYTAADPWQRVVGYNEIFDTLAPMTFIDFDTARLKFEYGNKDWMIQLWKGQYGLIFYGAEIGVYNKPKDRALEHYDCASDSELIKMSMDFCEYENRVFGKDEWVKKFSRPYGYYWWCTGFIPGNKLGNFSSLRLEVRMTMKDYEMLMGVTSALADNNIGYDIKGLDVYFTYA